MFENLGKRIQSILLILIIALLSVVMGVIGFGTPGGEGCNPQEAAYAAVVHGETVTQGDFRAAFLAARFDRMPAEAARAQRLREHLLEGLIERELLVHEAERLGFTADPAEVERRTVRDQVILFSAPVDAPYGFPSGALPYDFNDRDGQFSTDTLRRTIQYGLRRSVDEFRTWQVKETLAQRVRDLVTSNVSVSTREVWDAYVDETERATLSYVRFNPTYYRDRVEVTEEAIAAWMGQNAEEVDREYRRQRHRFTNLEAQVHTRQILVRVADGASEEDRAAARTRAEGLLARARAGEDFAALAREHSDDETTKAQGGDMGWRARQSPGMVAAYETAAFALENGQITENLVESQFGFHIIKLEGKREGNVPEAEAKRELADGLYRRARAAELAREEAQRALAYLREGHTTEELDERLRNNWADTPTPTPPPPAEGEAPEGEPERPALAPQVHQTQPFGRSDRAIPGAFDSTPLTQAAFEMSTDEPLPDEPMQLGEDFFVYRLDERTEATQEGFTDEVQTRIEQGLLTDKRAEALRAYVERLRDQAEADGAIRRNPEVLEYGDTDEEGEEGSEESASR